MPRLHSLPRGEGKGEGGRRGTAHCAFPGRTSSTTISSENDTSGAHDGEVSAIVTDYETPITIPAIKGPSARPSPPIITTAKMTPIHA